VGMFIRLEIDRTACTESSGCAQCVEVCPVDVFVLEDDVLGVSAQNEDECTLCGLCLSACPGEAIRLIRLYEVEA